LRNNTIKYLHKSGDMTNTFVMLFDLLNSGYSVRICNAKSHLGKWTSVARDGAKGTEYPMAARQHTTTDFQCKRVTWLYYGNDTALFWSISLL